MKLSLRSHAFARPVAGSQAGSTLLVALSVVLVMAVVGANVLFSISSRYNSAYRSASWNEALLTAEAGVDITVSELLRTVPNVSITSTGGIGTGYSQPSLGLITGLNISPAGLLSTTTPVLSVTPPSLVHAGEGGTVQQATVSIEVLPMSQFLSSGGGVAGLVGGVTGLVNGNDMQLLRLRSTGTVCLTGGTAAGISRQDNDLWRPSLVTDRNSGQTLINGPTVARQIEVVLRPVYPFEGAVTTNDSFTAADSTSVFDSFNSTLSTASTGDLYDSLKRLSHGAVRVNSSIASIGGKVYGDVSTNGAAIAANKRLTGTINNTGYTPLPLVTAPTWPGNSAPSSISGGTTLPAGILLTPMQYRFGSISGSLHITKGLLGLGTNVEIYVTGDITGSIEIDSGITAKLYVAGNLVANTSQIKNDSHLAANLQIYGVPSPGASTPQISLYADASLAAAIYAPAHNVTIYGNNDISGAIVANKFLAYGVFGSVRVHYDEALAANIGPLLRYQIAGWNEITARN